MNRRSTALLAVAAGMLGAVVTAMPFDPEMMERIGPNRRRNRGKPRTFYAGGTRGRAGSVQNTDYLVGAWRGDGVASTMSKQKPREGRTGHVGKDRPGAKLARRRIGDWAGYVRSGNKLCAPRVSRGLARHRERYYVLLA